MTFRVAWAAAAISAFVALATPARAEVTTPDAHFGFRPGTDRRLASMDAIEQYFERVAAETDRVTIIDLGGTTEATARLQRSSARPRTSATCRRFEIGRAHV